MRIVPTDGVPAADLTARARIRDAGIACFAADGFQKANLRAIAAAAGVSAGLVIHHFGSKAGLREACDEYVLQVLVQRARSDATTAGLQGVMREYQANPGDYHRQMEYMARAITDDSFGADRFVGTMVAETEAVLKAGIADGSMHPSSDLRALAVLTLLNSLAMLTMAPSLTRALGYQAMTAEALWRVAVPSLEIYTHGLYTDDRILKSIQDALPDLPADTPTDRQPDNG